MPVCNQKFDVHAHATLIKYPDPNCIFLSPEQVLEKYAQYGISQGLLLPEVSPEHHLFCHTTQEVETIVQQYPGKFYGAMSLDPRMLNNNHMNSNYGPLLEYYKSRGAKSVGEMTANIPFDDPLYDALLAQCAEHNLPVTIHISPAVGYDYGVVDEPGLPRLEKMLKKYPKLKIFGHSQAFWAHMSTNVDSELMKGYPTGKVTPGRLFELFEKYDNLYGDLSAGSGFNSLARDEESGLNFLSLFQDKLMFGCDFCRPSDIGKLAMWLDKMYTEGRLSEEVYLKICRENAIRILKLQ